MCFGKASLSDALPKPVCPGYVRERMHTEIPPRPTGVCEFCKQPYAYTENRNISPALRQFSFLQQKFYWVPTPHPACEEAAVRHESSEKQQRQRDDKDREARRLLREFGLPKHLDDRTFENFRITPDNEKAVKAAQAWRPGSPSLLFYGPPGRGKSHLMAAIVNRWSLAGMLVAYENINRLLNSLRAGYGDDTYDERFALVTSRRVPILVLDDLGTEKSTEWSEPAIFQVLDERLKQKLSTFVTTNLTPEELARKYHERIPSRLKELCTWVEMNGPDWREAMARQRADKQGLPPPPRVTRSN